MSKEKATERISRSTTPGKNKKSHTGLIISASLVSIVVVSTSIFLVLGKDSPSDKAIASEYNRVITSENIEEVIEQLDKKELTPIGSYEVKMNTEWTFPDGDSPSTNAYVENVANNQQTVFFTIALSGSDEVICKSPYLPVGSHLENIKLDKPLEKGTYDAVITYHLVDKDYNETSSVNISIVLTFEN